MFRFSRADLRSVDDCIEKLRAKIVTAPKDVGPGQTLRNRPTHESNESEKEYIISAFKRIHPALALATCSMEAIYLEDDSNIKWNGFAWAEDFSAANSLAPRGAIMRINRNILKRLMSGELTIEEYQGKKTAKIFEDNLGEQYTISYESNIRVIDFMIAHEMTHLLDFANGFTRIKDIKCAAKFFFDVGQFTSDCEFDRGYRLFSTLNWSSMKSPKYIDVVLGSDQEDKNNALIRMVLDGKKLPASRAVEFFELLRQKTDVISVYQIMSDAMEDMAELASLFTYKMLNPEAKYVVVIHDKSGNEVFRYDFLNQIEGNAMTVRKINRLIKLIFKHPKRMQRMEHSDGYSCETALSAN
jgi:hypothetical protein